MIYSFCPSVKGCLLGALRGKTKLSHTTQQCDCKLGGQAEKCVTQLGTLVAAAGQSCPCHPIGSQCCQHLCSALPTEMLGCDMGSHRPQGEIVDWVLPSFSPSPSHSSEKPALNFFPSLSCWGWAQRVASACHVTLVFAVSHAMTSQADWHTMEITLLYVKMEKLSLSRKQAAEHQLQMGMKKKLVWVDERIAFKRQTQLPPMSMESLTQTLMAMESCPKALYFFGMMSNRSISNDAFVLL